MGLKAVAGGNSGSTSGGTPASIANGGNTFNAVVTAAPYNASGFIVQSTTSNSVGANSFSIPVSNTAGFAVGQIVIIALAGTSNQKNFAGVIGSITPTNIFLSAIALTLPAGTMFALTSSTSAAGTIAAIPAGYLVYSVGMTQLMAGANSGNTSITVADASTYAVGQGILIFGANSAGSNLISSITAINGNVLSIANVIVTSIATGAYVQHDNTAAFQAVANLVTVNKNINAFVPDGYYQINGAAQNVSTANAVVQLPAINYYSASLALWNPQTTFRMAGNVPAPQNQSYLATSKMPHVSGVVIQTDLGSLDITTLTASAAQPATSVTVANASSYATGQSILIANANGGNPLTATVTGVAGNVISFTPATNVNLSIGNLVNHVNGTPNLFASYNANSLTNFSNIQFCMDNISFRAYPSPNVRLLNNQYIESIKFTGFNVDTGETGPTPLPLSNVTNDNFAIVGPDGNNGGNNLLKNWEIDCFFWGLQVAEHTRIEQGRFGNCYWPLSLGTNSGQSQYGITAYDIEFNACPNSIRSYGSNSVLIDFQMINIEHEGSPGWVSPLTDTSDPGHCLQGNMTIDTQAGTGINISNTPFLNVYNYRRYNSLNGTTAGNIQYFAPVLNGYKKSVYFNVNGYENNTAVNQTITFPTAFLLTPVIAENNTGLTLAATTTTLTITAPNSTTTFTGYIEINGY